MKTGVRPAQRRDIPALAEIWQVCFHDPDDYIRYFYRENFDRISIPVFTVNDTPVSMLHLLDAVFMCGTQQREARLIYAAGTLPAYRQSGYMGALLRQVTAQAKQADYALFLKPSSPYLADYYQAFGFAQDAVFRRVSVFPGETCPLPVSPLSAADYNRMRNEAFSSRPYVRWPDRHVRWCVDENEWYGGKTLAVEMDGAVHFLMGAPEDGTLLITETDLSLSQLKRASGTLCALFGTDLLKAYLPDFSCAEGEAIVSSVVFNAPMNHTYVNLILI